MCAVSGGMDSMVLLHAMHAVGLDIVVGHVNHGLRPEAGQDQQLVEETAEKLGLRCISCKVDAAKWPGSPEQAAREARYAALAKIAKLAKANIIATAHHQTDQAETLMLHALRGSPPHGMAKLTQAPLGKGAVAAATEDWRSFYLGTDSRSRLLRVRRVQQKAFLRYTHCCSSLRQSSVACGRQLLCLKEPGLVRPFLSIPHSEIQAYAAENNILYNEDATNASEAYLRNRVRRGVLPALETALPGATKRLAQAAEIASDEQEYLQQQVNRFIEKNKIIRPDGLFIPIEPLKIQHIAMKKLIIREAARRTGTKAPSFDFTEYVLQLLDAAPGTVYNGLVHREQGGLLFGGSLPTAKPVPLKEGTIYFDNIKIKAKISQAKPQFQPNSAALCLQACQNSVFRFATPTDTFQPLNTAGPRTLYSRLRDRGLPPTMRPHTTVLARNTTVLWVPGWTIAHEARIIEPQKAQTHLCIKIIGGHTI